MPRKYLISGGGTGGHIFPAIAIANAIREREEDAEILFVGAEGKMEMEKVPAAGYEIIGLKITGLQRKLSLANLMFPFKLLFALLRARGIIKNFQPNVVIGVGGFASGPVMRMSTWMGIATVIQEQNSFAGMVNRWVASMVDRACVAYPGMEKFFPKERIKLTGNPVRKEVVDIEGKRDEALKKYGFSADKPVLLIIGGSLGARSINLALAERVGQLLDEGLQVLWQTGKLFAEQREQIAEKFKGKPLEITEFIYEMDMAYAAADIVVSRAGAIAVSELSIVAKPTILVPFPHAADDHQTKNALALVETNAAMHVKDAEVKTELVPAILELMRNENMQAEFKKNIRHHAYPFATKYIVDEITALAAL